MLWRFLILQARPTKHGRKATLKSTQGALSEWFPVQRGSTHSQAQNRMLVSSAGLYYEIDFSGKTRRLLFQSKQEAVGAVAMAPSKNPCFNPPNGVSCQPAPSTLVIVISGMCAMMLLVVIAIVLLCCSHLKYRRAAERNQQASRDGSGPVASAVPDESTSCDNVVLVLLPGEKIPVRFARPCPLQEEEESQVQLKQASSDVKKGES